MRLKKYASEKNDNLSRKIKSYSAITGAFLSAAGAAQGQIVYTDVNPDTVLQNTSFDIDMDGDGNKDYALQQISASAGAYNGAYVVGLPGHYSNRVIAKKGGSSYYYPSRLAAGALIGPANINFKSFQNAPNNIMSLVFQASTTLLGYWSGQSGYIGVKFKTGANNHYGWIQCQVATNGTAITVKGYAYESTPDSSIAAGDTTSSATGIKEERNIELTGNFYPNPAVSGQTAIVINAKKQADLKLEVMNGMGQLMLAQTRKLIAGKNIVRLNLGEIPHGIYFVKFITDNQAVYRKISTGR